MSARPFLIAGHPRSGTTILNRVCNTHPEVVSTFEFGAFLHLGRPYAAYREALRIAWRRKHRPLLGVGEATPGARRRRSRGFLARYLLALQRHRRGAIDLSAVRASLGFALGSPVVGDKLPAYVFLLDELSAIEELRCVVIVRDCRAVVASTLERVRTGWSGEEWTDRFDSTRKAAANWVGAVESTERNAARIHVLRFEDLLRDREATITAIGRFLEVDPTGFDAGLLREPAREKFRVTLDDADLEVIESVAGETMLRWGYGY